MKFDLSEAKAARNEALDTERHSFTFEGQEFTLPPKLPVGLLEHLGGYLQKTQGGTKVPTDPGEIGGAITELFDATQVLLGKEQWEEFKGLGADLTDILAVLTFTIRAFKVGEGSSEEKSDEAIVGESPASGSPSSDSGATSKPTGNGSTGETSEPTSTEDVSLSDASASSS